MEEPNILKGASILLRKSVNVGLFLGLIGFTHWILLLIPILNSIVFTNLINIIVIFLWAYCNYRVLSEGRDESIGSKIVQLYGVSFLIFILGAIGEYFNVTIFGIIFSIYFLPFIDISIVVFRNFMDFTSYLFVPFLSMIATSLVTFFYYLFKIRHGGKIMNIRVK